MRESLHVLESGSQVQNAIYLAGGAEWPVSAEDWEAAAREKLEQGPFDYVAGGAGSEATVRANREAFERRRLRPRMLTGNAERELSVEVLGLRSPAPFLLAPVGVLSIVHPEAELGVARASKATGVPMILSSAASTSLEDVAAELGDAQRWFQLYWWADRELAGSLVDRAAAAGYGAIVVTLDTLTLGWRDRDLRNGYLPFLGGQGLAQFFSDPLFRERLDAPPEEDVQTASLMALAAFPNLALTWGDLEWLRARTDLPILVKGVLTAEDARLALEHGVDGIVVSNHGGRQVDGAVAVARRARRGARRGRPGRDRADGQRHPPRRRRPQGARARRRRGPARPPLRLRARGRRRRGRRGRDPPARGRARPDARAGGRPLRARARPKRGHVKLYTEEHGDGHAAAAAHRARLRDLVLAAAAPGLVAAVPLHRRREPRHGRSPKPPGPYSIEELADDAAEALEGRRAHVAGFSMGGYIAQTLAVRHPELVDRLVLDLHRHRRARTSCRRRRRRPRPGRRTRTGRRRSSPARRCRCRSAPAGRTSTPTSSRRCSPTGSSTRRRPSAGARSTTRASTGSRASTPVEQIEAPTLVVHGDADRVVPYENGVELARRIPGSRFETLPGGGHLLFLEEAARFNAMVASFLSD